MKDFTYYAPTRVVFGKDAIPQVGRLTAEQGATKVLVHFGGGSAVRSGLLERVTDSLTAAGVSYITLGGAQPNPRMSLVYKGIDLCQTEQVDFILAVGGGSVIDSAKAIAYGCCCNYDVWDLYDCKQKPAASLPIGCVLTHSATGSEMSDSSVLTNDLIDDNGIKRGVHSDLCRCRFAVLDPTVTCSLSKFQTACGVVDILMHSLERYFGSADGLELTDALNEALLRTVMTNGAILMAEPDNFQARAEIMWAGSLSHNGLTGCGRQGDWACHQIEHELSGMFDAPHGAGLAAIWGTWARYVINEQPERFARLAVNVLHIEDGEPLTTGLRGVERMEEYFRSLDMPVNCTELLGFQLNDEQIDELARKCTHHDRKVGSVRQLGTTDVKRILEAAK